MQENFEELLNQQQEINVGDVVEVEVVQIEDNQLVVSLPNGLQGAVPAREFTTEKDVDLNTLAAIGDRFDVLVVKPVVGNATEEGFSFILSKNQLAQRAVWTELEGHVGEIVKVTVSNAVKGGLTVEYNGVRGFIPGSMVSDRFISNFAQFKGQELEAKIVEVDAANKRFILNRREVLVAQKSAVLETLNVDEIVTGTVARLTDFGAFIDLGGVDGLVHVSEISHGRVNKPSDVLSVGDSVEVKILSINPEDERISLSVKATVPGPWEKIEDEATVGSTLEGVVKRLTTFGAFVEIFPGIDGLVHLSEISRKHIQTPQEVLTVGETVQVKVLAVDTAAQRVSLSIKALLPVEEGEVDEEEVDVNAYLENQNKEDNGFSLGDVVENATELTEE